MGVNKEATPYFRLSDILQYTFGKMERRPSYKYLLLILGLPVHLIVFLFYLIEEKRRYIHLQFMKNKGIFDNIRL